MSCGVGGWLAGHAMGEGGRLQTLCGGVNGLSLVTEGEAGRGTQGPIGSEGEERQREAEGKGKRVVAEMRVQEGLGLRQPQKP